MVVVCDKKNISGVVTWLKNWFYDKDEVDSITDDLQSQVDDFKWTIIPVTSANPVPKPFLRLFHFEDTGTSRSGHFIFEMAGRNNDKKYAKIRVDIRRESATNSSFKITPLEVMTINLDDFYWGFYYDSSKTYLDVYKKVVRYEDLDFRLYDATTRQGTITKFNPSPVGDESYATVESASTTLYNKNYTNITNGASYEITADKFIKQSGTSSQFLKADGSVDSNSYIVNGTGTVTSTNILDKTIVNDDIADGTISRDKIASKTITANQIADGTISRDKIASKTITANQIADSTLTSDKIANGTIVNEDISASANIDFSKINKSIDTTATQNSNNLITSGGVYDGLYTPTNISININFNDYTTPGMWSVWSAEEKNNTNAPDSQGGLFVVKKAPNGVDQLLMQYWSDEPKIFYRNYHNTKGWSQWNTIMTSTLINASSTNTKDLDDYITSGFYYCTSNANQGQYISNKPENRTTCFFLLVEDWGKSSYTKQTLTYYDNAKTYIRTRSGGTWKSWNEVSYEGHIHSYDDLTNKPSYTPTVTSSTTNSYKIGSTNISGSNVDIYGVDTKYSPATVEPKTDHYVNGVVGTSTKYAREDHKHTKLFNWTTGGVTTATYVNLLEIKATSSWNDRPITFTLQKREKTIPTYVSIKLTNTDISSANYDIASFKIWGDTTSKLYLRQTATNTWNLIAYKDANDSYHITDLYSGMSDVTLTGLNSNFGTSEPTSTSANPVYTPIDLTLKGNFIDSHEYTHTHGTASKSFINIDSNKYVFNNEYDWIFSCDVKFNYSKGSGVGVGATDWSGHLRMGLNVSGTFAIWHGTATGGEQSQTFSNITLNTDTYYHFTIVKLGYSAYWYLDGALVYETTLDWLKNYTNVPVKLSEWATDASITVKNLYGHTIDNSPNNDVEYLETTHGTTATNVWTATCRKIRTLQKGTKIFLKILSAGTSTGATLNLTLNDGTTTGAKSIYFKGTSVLTTHYPQNAVIGLIYDGSAWRVISPNDNNSWNDNAYGGVQIKCGESLANGVIAGAKSSDGLYYKLASGLVLDASYPLVQLTANKNANDNTNQLYNRRYDLTITTTKSMTLTSPKPVYVEGTNYSNGQFTVSSNIVTQTLVSGNYYWLIGFAYDGTHIRFDGNNKEIFYYNGSKLIPVEDYKYSTTSHGHGDITNGGAITSSTVGFASGDVPIVADASASGKLQKGIVPTGYIKDDTSQNYTNMGLSTTGQTQKQINTAINTTLGNILANTSTYSTLTISVSGNPAVFTSSNNGDFSNSSNLILHKFGKIVIADFRVVSSSNLSTTYVDFLDASTNTPHVLPVEYRPSAIVTELSHCHYNTSTPSILTTQVYDTGRIKMRVNNSTRQVNTYFRMIWIV